MADEARTSDATDERTDADAPDTPTPDTDETSATESEWKARARLWESRAKANADAAAKLAEIEDAQKTAAERAADAQAAAEHRAAAAEARALRREVALEHKLTAADAELLDGITDEDVMRALAKRLAAPVAPSGPRSPLEGGTPTNRPRDEEMRSFVDRLAGRGN